MFGPRVPVRSERSGGRSVCAKAWGATCSGAVSWPKPTGGTRKTSSASTESDSPARRVCRTTSVSASARAAGRRCSAAQEQAREAWRAVVVDDLEPGLCLLGHRGRPEHAAKVGALLVVRRGPPDAAAHALRSAARENQIWGLTTAGLRRGLQTADVAPRSACALTRASRPAKQAGGGWLTSKAASRAPNARPKHAARRRVCTQQQGRATACSQAGLAQRHTSGARAGMVPGSSLARPDLVVVSQAA